MFGDTTLTQLIFGRLTWESIPYHEPILVATFIGVAIGGLAILALITRYKPGMHYGPHTDVAFLQATPQMSIRSDISCTIFLNDPEEYEGGALKIQLGDGVMRFKLNPGEAIVYPSDTLHEVEAVTSGERLVGITFMQSRIPDPFRRNLLYNLNEVAALEGLKMSQENYTLLQLVQNQLLRYWGEKP